MKKLYNLNKAWLKYFWLLLLSCFFTVQVSAQSVGVDFSQSSNKNPTLGDVVWIGSIIQQNNSVFNEGQSTLQRTILEGIPTHPSGEYRLRFTHQSTKGSINAYDFVTGWGGVNPSFGNIPQSLYEGAIETSNAISAGCFNLINQTANTGPKGTRAPFFATVPYVYATPVPPSDMAGVGGIPGVISNTLSSGSNVAARMVEFDGGDGGVKRQVTIQGTRGANNTNLVTSAQLVFLGYDSGSDQYAMYELIWNGPTAGDPYDVQFKMAGHIAQSFAPNNTGYGPGKGAANISGGPYHFKLEVVYLGPPVNGAWTSANTKSLGAQDNQLKGADILIPPPPSCVVQGPENLCQNTEGTYQTAPADAYAWSLANNGTGAFFVGPTDGPSVQVNSGNSEGIFDVVVVVTIDGLESEPCQVTTSVYPSPACSINGPESVCPKAEVVYSAPEGMASYLWEVTGGTILGANDQPTVTVVAGNTCGEFTLSLTISDVNECESTCEKVVSIVDEEAPIISNCPTEATNLGCNPDPEEYAPSLLPDWTDNCGINDSGVRAGTPVADAEGCGWSVTHVYYAIDYCEQETTCQQKFTWKEDLVAPEITAEKQDAYLDCNPTEEAILAALGTATATDNCDLQVLVDYEDGDVVEDGCMRSITRTFTAMDECKNPAEPVTVTVSWKEDLVAPEITAEKQDAYLDCNPTEEAILAALGTATATDNCDLQVLVDYEDGDVVEDGCMRSTTRTFTAMDECENPAEPVTVTVSWKEDLNAPQPETLLTDLDFECTEDVVIPDPMFTDNCQEGVIPYTCKIAGTDIDCADYVFPEGETEICFTAEDDCENVNTICILVTVLPCKDEYCTYTQGKYGNQGKSSACDLEGKVATSLFVANLLAQGDMVIGAGGNKIIFGLGDGPVINSILPGGGGSGVLSGTCDASIAALTGCLKPYLNKQGKLTNGLLAQTITLGLNLRIHADGRLGDFVLESGKYLVTQKKVSCEEGSGVVDPVCDEFGVLTVNPYWYYTLNKTVVAYLSNPVNGYSATVNGLYMLANDALGGKVLPAGMSLSNIMSVVDMINNAFDECRAFAGYWTDKYSCTTVKIARIEPSGNDDATMKVYPNPFKKDITFEFVSAKDTHAVLEITNILGQKITTLMDSKVKMGVLNRIEYQPENVVPGILIYRLILDGKVQNGRIVYQK